LSWYNYVVGTRTAFVFPVYWFTTAIAFFVNIIYWNSSVALRTMEVSGYYFATNPYITFLTIIPIHPPHFSITSVFSITQLLYKPYGIILVKVFLGIYLNKQGG